MVEAPFPVAVIILELVGDAPAFYPLLGILDGEVEDPGAFDMGEDGEALHEEVGEEGMAVVRSLPGEARGLDLRVGESLAAKMVDQIAVRPPYTHRFQNLLFVAPCGDEVGFGAVAVLVEQPVIVIGSFDEDALPGGELHVAALWLGEGHAYGGSGPFQGLMAVELVVFLEKGKDVTCGVALKAFEYAFGAVYREAFMAAAEGALLEVGALHLEAGLALDDGEEVGVLFYELEVSHLLSRRRTCRAGPAPGSTA